MKLALCLFATVCLAPLQASEQDAVAYLAREVSNWPKDNHCFSCHNNGDGVRVLFLAKTRGLIVDPKALEDTTAFLREPSQWDGSNSKSPAGDPKLARIQFAAALLGAIHSGFVAETSVRRAAAEAVREYQDASGAWKIDGDGPGSPATYGTALATYMASQALEGLDDAHSREQITRAKGWMQTLEPKSNVDRAARMLMAGSREEDIRIFLSSQTKQGGWGPYPGTPAEVFDTSLVLLALNHAGTQPPDVQKAILNGRAYLTKTQVQGGWPETTRPSGNQSYAQHISTTAWALQALLSTAQKR